MKIKFKIGFNSKFVKDADVNNILMTWKANCLNGAKCKVKKVDSRNGWSRRKPKKFPKMIKSSRLVGVG